VRLKNKVAVVTGAASGFGASIAQRYAEEGAKLVLADLNADGVGHVAGEIRKAGGDCRAMRADVTVRADWERIVQSAQQAHGRLDIVVNNAGWTHRLKPFLETTDEEFERVFAANVKSVFLSAQHVIPVFRKQGQGGCLIQIASTLGVRPRPGLTPYSASKSAVITLSQSLAVEFGSEKIRVNVINPAFALTGLAADFMGGKDTPEMRQKFLNTIPLGRLTTPLDIANAAVFLASNEADFITGAVMQVDGGRAV
jgi:3-oxoacyl-[acyl-carrier protein] reductase